MIIGALWLLLIGRFAFSLGRAAFGPRHYFGRNFARLIADATTLCLFALISPK